MQFMGCVVGDYTKSAINTAIFTGKTVGICSMLYGFVTDNVPSFLNYARQFGKISEVSVAAATTLSGRLAKRYGDVLNVAVPNLPDGVAPQRLFPRAPKLLRARLGDLGIINSRAETIRRVAKQVAEDKINFDRAYAQGDAPWQVWRK